MGKRRVRNRHCNTGEEQGLKTLEVCQPSGSMDEQNQLLPKEREDLLSQVRALESQRDQLNSELRQKDQRLKDKEDEVQVLEKRFDKAKVLLADYVASSSRLSTNMKDLNSTLELKVAEYEGLKKELSYQVTIDVARLENTLVSTLQEAAEEKAALQNLYEQKLVLTLQEAAEEKAALQNLYEQKLSLLRSEVTTLKQDLQTREAEVEDFQTRAAEKLAKQENTLVTTLQEAAKEKAALQNLYEQKLVLTLQEAAEEKAALQHQYEQKLSLQRSEVTTLKQDLQTREAEVEDFQTRAAEKLAKRENTLVTALQEAAEEKAALQHQYEQKLSLLRSEVTTLKQDLQTREAEVEHFQTRAAEKDRDHALECGALKEQLQSETRAKEKTEELLESSRQTEEAWIAKEDKWMEDKHQTNLDIQVLLGKVTRLDKLTSMTDKEKAKMKKAEKKARKKEKKRIGEAGQKKE